MYFRKTKTSQPAQISLIETIVVLLLIFSDLCRNVNSVKFLECVEMRGDSNAHGENCTISNLNDIFVYKVPIHLPLSVTRSKKNIICIGSRPEYFPAIVFETFTRAERFTASKDCTISKLANQPFSKAGYLRELRMPHNSLRFLVNNIFKGAPRLQVVDISHNKIDTINDNVFGFMRYLRYLDLSYNELWSLSLVLQVNGPMELKASHNHITSLSIKSDHYVPRTMNIEVDVRHNYISRLDIPHVPITSLQLDHNHLQQVSSLARIKRLIRFSLFNNPIFSTKFTREPYTPKTKIHKALFVQTPDNGIEPVIGMPPSNCTGGFELGYCLNGGVCMNFNIDENIVLLTCICPDPYFGERCEEKALYGSYVRRTRPIAGYPTV